VWFPVLAAASLWLGLWAQQNGLPIPGTALITGFSVAVLWAAWRKQSWQMPILFAGLVAVRFLVSQSPLIKGFFATLTMLGVQQRKAIASSVAGLSQGSKALVLGLTDGDTALLPNFLADQLKELSLTHLNAVSGTNCSIVLAMVLIVAKQLALPRLARGLAAGAGLVLYLVLVGDQPSVLRAAVMAAIMLVGLLGGKRYRPVHLLALGVVCLLLSQPDLASSLGLALSAAATLGVLEFAPRMGSRLGRWLPEWLALAVAVAFTAQIFCLPLLVSLQSEFSLLGLLANILAEPVVPFITVLGAAGAVLCWICPPLAPAAFWLASIGAQFLVVLCSWLSSYDLNLNWPGGGWGFVLALALVLAIFASIAQRATIRRWGLWIAVLLVIAIVPRMLLALPTGAFPVAGWFYVACDVGQGDGTVIRSQGKIAVIDVGREPVKINRCLNRLGVSHISLLVLTHFDLDHVGGLAGAISGRRVDEVLVTDFVDERPGAFIANLQLARRGMPMIHGYFGVTGRVGDFSWLALSPHKGGADSSDSNDGSVSLYFTNGSVGIFTMADLPATGQGRLMAEKGKWWQPAFRTLPTILKLSHHGSADQEPAFIRWVNPDIATVSVGVGNPYGHPTERALAMLRAFSSVTLRTDQLGSISVAQDSSGSLIWASEKRG
jgi:competence protein ComEC